MAEEGEQRAFRCLSSGLGAAVGEEAGRRANRLYWKEGREQGCMIAAASFETWTSATATATEKNAAAPRTATLHLEAVSCLLQEAADTSLACQRLYPQLSRARAPLALAARRRLWLCVTAPCHPQARPYRCAAVVRAAVQQQSQAQWQQTASCSLMQRLLWTETSTRCEKQHGMPARGNCSTIEGRGARDG